MEFYAIPPIDGAFAECVTIQSHFAFAVPDEISDDASALMEPLSVGIAAARKGGITAGSRVVVTGTFRYANTWPLAIDLVRTGRVDLVSLVSGHFGLDQVEAALRESTTPTNLKTMVLPGSGS